VAHDVEVAVGEVAAVGVEVAGERPADAAELDREGRLAERRHRGARAAAADMPLRKNRSQPGPIAWASSSEGPLSCAKIMWAR
jgi:hypothetical protein